MHPWLDMKGHTNGVLSTGQGAVYSSSRKTNHSQFHRKCACGQVQGLPVTEAVLHQDNQSCVLVARNGRQSSSNQPIEDMISETF
jgi:hypothetical protein